MDKALIFAYSICVCKGMTESEESGQSQDWYKQQDSGSWQIRYRV